MSDRTRYQAQALYQEKADVSSYRGVDPVTGLPVLIYRFGGKADPALPRLDSEYLPRLLAWRDDEAGGVMVVAWSSAFVPAGDRPLDNLQLLDSARALVDAAAAGVTHGDISPERFLLAGDSVVLEGFGVPWSREEVTAEADVLAWARSIRQLGHAGGPGVTDLIDEIEGGGGLQPDRLLSRLRDLLLRGEKPAAQPERDDGAVQAAEQPATAVPAVDQQAQEPGGSLDLDWDGFSRPEDPDLDFSTDAGGIQSALDIELEYNPVPRDEAATAPDEAGSQAGPVDPAGHAEVEAAGEPAPEDDEAVFRPSSAYASERLAAVQTVAPEPAQPLPAGGSSSYLKRIEDREAPPAVPTGSARDGSRAARQQEFNPGRSGPPDPGSRRTIMFVVLLILCAVLVTLLFYLRRSNLQNVPEPLPQSVTYVIDVLVEPGDLPPVNLYVLSSPEGSGLMPNTILGTAPRRMALDAEGTWVFEGRFQGRVSDPVTIRIPEDRSSAVTIVIPPEEPEEE